MKITPLILALALASCQFEFREITNEVQDYHWLGIAGTEEIRNDTIFTYNGTIGSADFTSRIIHSVSDSSFSYLYFDKNKDGWEEANATFETTMKDNIPYLIVYFENSVSMFTRKRTCPLKF